MDENKNEVVTDELSFDSDVEGFLNDDGQEDLDALFSQTDEDVDALISAAGDDPAETERSSDASYLLSLLNESEGADAPTTGDPAASDAGQPEAGEGSHQTAPNTAGPRKLTLKVNHQERVVDISDMSDDELRGLLQRGYAFDALKDAEDRRTFLKVYREQMDAGMTETVARLVARDAAGGKDYEVKDGEIVEPPAQAPRPAAPTSAAPTQPPVRPKRDLRAEVAQLRILYPDVKQMPDEVARAVSKGVPLLSAYQAWRERESSKAAAAMKKENKTLRQNAANAARAPVRGVTGGDTSSARGQSIFEEAFDAGLNWS